MGWGEAQNLIPPLGGGCPAVCTSGRAQGAPRTGPTRPRVEWTSPDPDTAGIGPRGSSTLSSQPWPVHQNVTPGAEDWDSNQRLSKGTALCLGPHA